MRRLVEPAPVENRINVTPIIDVALVLVIILLITGPMLAVAELELVLPEARTGRGRRPSAVNTVYGAGPCMDAGVTSHPAGRMAPATKETSVRRNRRSDNTSILCRGAVYNPTR